MISLIAIVTLFTLLSSLAAATCDCGFSINSTDSPKHQVFTNFIETDFTRAILGGWEPQSYYVAQPIARGPYGKNATVHNVVPTKQGLQLWVRNSSSDSVPMGEVSTKRKDIVYGSFRIKAKMTGINGTCAGLFWYRNDTQEIDMEFLSRQYENGGVVNLVNQSPRENQSPRDNDAHHLPFRPDGDFHEYRFDWLPGSVSFYADGNLLREYTEEIPHVPGHMGMNHWSNGNTGWSAGPPTQDTAITIQYARMYFNSSDLKENKLFHSVCPNYDPAKVCKIHDDALMPPVSTTGTSYDAPSTAPNVPSSSPNKAHNIETIVGVSVAAAIIVFVLAFAGYKCLSSGTAAIIVFVSGVNAVFCWRWIRGQKPRSSPVDLDGVQPEEFEMSNMVEARGEISAAPISAAPISRSNPLHTWSGPPQDRSHESDLPLYGSTQSDPPPYRSTESDPPHLATHPSASGRVHLRGSELR